MDSVTSHSNQEQQEKFLVESINSLMDSLPEEKSYISISSIALEKTGKVARFLMHNMPNVWNVIASAQQKKIYAVTQEFLDRMQKETLHFTNNSKGDAFAPVVRDCNDKIAAHADIREMDFPSNAPQAIALFALQKQLAEISYQLEDIKDCLDSVISGQWNDRLAQIDSAKKQFLLAQKINDPICKKNMLCQAVKSATEGERAILISLNDDLEHSATEKSKFFSKNKKEDLIQKQILQSLAHFQSLTEAYQLELLIFDDLQEYSAISYVAERAQEDFKRLFTQDRLLELNSQTLKKDQKNMSIDKNFWTQTFKERLDGCFERLSLVKQSALLLEKTKTEERQK